MFTYDQNSNIFQAFFESWCPNTNTLCTSVGDLSIFLWDLHKIEGLPIGALPYKKVAPEDMELIGVDEKNERFIICSFEFLLIVV